MQDAPPSNATVVNVSAAQGVCHTRPSSPVPRGMARALIPHLLPPSVGAAPGGGAVPTPVALSTRGPSEKAEISGREMGVPTAGRGCRNGATAEAECLSSQPPACAQTLHSQADVPQDGDRRAVSFYR